jgi:tetratricopeptide (TPR) repeat protein
MKNRLACLAVALLVYTGLVSAQSGKGVISAWQESYKQEAAGKYAPAQFALEPILRDSPGNDFALMRRAWLNYLQGRHHDAVRDYTQALLLNPRSLEARLALSLPLMAQQQWKEAEIELRKVIGVSAWDYTAHSRLLVCEEGQRKWNELAQHAAELASRYPSDANALLYLARGEAWLGNVKKAQAAYMQVLERAPAHVEAANYLLKNSQ